MTCSTLTWHSFLWTSSTSGIFKQVSSKYYDQVSIKVMHVTHMYTHMYIRMHAFARAHTHTHTHKHTHTHTDTNNIADIIVRASNITQNIGMLIRESCNEQLYTESSLQLGTVEVVSYCKAQGSSASRN